MDLAKKHVMLSGKVPIEFSCFQQDVKKAPFNRNILPQDVKTQKKYSKDKHKVKT